MSNTTGPLADIEVAITANLEPLRAGFAQGISEAKTFDTTITNAGKNGGRAFSQIIEELRKQTTALDTIVAKTGTLEAAIERAAGAARDFNNETGRGAGAARDMGNDHVKAWRDVQAEIKKTEADQRRLRAENAAWVRDFSNSMRMTRAEQLQMVAEARASETRNAFGVSPSFVGPGAPTRGPEASDHVDAYQRSLEALREKYVPLHAAELQHKKTLDEIGLARRRGALDVEEATAAITREEAAYARLTRNITDRDVTERPSLTSNQRLNLSRQANDVLTMGFMGASPTQIIASQAGQIYGALEEGPRGLRGSMDAIKASVMGVVSSINPLTAAFVGLGVVGTGVLYAIADRFPDATRIAAEHEKVIERVAARYERLPGLIDRARRESDSSLTVSLQDQQKEETRLFERQVDQLQQRLAIGGRTGLGAGAFTELAPAAEKLFDDIERGETNFALLQRRMENIAADTSLADSTRDEARAFLELIAQAAASEKRLKELGIAHKELSLEVRRFHSASVIAGQALGHFTDVAPPLRNQFEELTYQFQRFETANRNLVGPSNTTQVYLRALAELSREAREELADAQATLATVGMSPNARAEAELRLQWDRRIADARRTNGSPDTIAAMEQTREVEIARMRAENSRDFMKASNDRVRAMIDEASALDLQIQSLGLGAGETARLKAETEGLAEAKRAADEAGMIVSDEEVAAIKASAAELGRLTTALATMSAEQDLLFERSQLYRSRAEAEVAAKLRDLGVDGGSAEGRRISDLVRGNIERQDARESFRSMFSGITSDVREATSALDLFESAKERALSFVDSQLDKTFENVADSLFNKFFPQGDLAAQIKAPGLSPAVASMQVTAASVTLSGVGLGALTGSPLSAPLGAVERAALPALDGKGGRVVQDAASARVAGAFEVTGSGMDAAKAAIRTIESGSAGGDYSAIGPRTRTGDRALGAYQVMGNNVPSWSKAALGRSVSQEEFLGSREIQDRIFEHRFGGYADKYGWEGASRAWFAGEGGMNRMGSKDVVGTSVSGYNSKFGALFAQHGGTDGAAVTRATTAIEQAAPQLSDATTTLTTGLQTLASDFGLQSSIMIDGMSGTVADFLPKFGGNLNKLLDAVAGGGTGSGGGLFDLFAAGRSAATGVSLGASKAILSGVHGGLFARGGISTSPAIFGEAGPEAAVPLPDGRRIPVALSIPTAAAMGNAGGGTFVFSPNVQVNASGGTPEQNADLARQTVDEMRAMVKGIIGEEFMNQRRNGGMFGNG